MMSPPLTQLRRRIDVVCTFKGADQDAGHSMNDLKEDHRPRVAMARRDKMRRKLLRAVMACAARGKQQIDDVIAEAGVSRATFYKYFSSVEEPLIEIGKELREELQSNIRVFIDQTDNPLGRVAAGVQIFLVRSVTDPVWGAFVSQTNYLAIDDVHNKMLAADLIVARERGLMEFDDIDAATSLLLGSSLEAVRHLSATNDRRRSYVEEVTVLILRAFGVPARDAREIVRDRAIFLRGLAPDHFSWWRDPWL
jgi:AcrR family transcriptional regulator